MVALDARTGAVVWTTVIADAEKGFTNTSGPIVVKGKVIQGLGGCERYQAERCFISAYDAKTGALAWKFHTVAHAGEPGGDTWNDLPDMMRQGGETWITGSYDPDVDLTFWGIAQAKPWMPVEPRHPRLRRRAAHRFHGRTQPRHRRPGLALPAPARRIARSRRGLREGVGGRRRPEGALHHRQVGHPVEARSPHRRAPRLQGDGVPERLRGHRPQDRAAHLSRRHPRAEDRPVDRRLPEHRGRPQLAGDELPSRAPTRWSSRSASRAWRSRPARSNRCRARAAPPPGGVSSRCPAATARSASWPPTTSAR